MGVLEFTGGCRLVTLQLILKFFLNSETLF